MSLGIGNLPRAKLDVRRQDGPQKLFYEDLAGATSEPVVIDACNLFGASERGSHTGNELGPEEFVRH
jgi:hypothetical protein